MKMDHDDVNAVYITKFNATLTDKLINKLATKVW